MKKYLFVLLIPFFLIGGCSDGEDTTATSVQTRTLEKAKEVEQLLQSEADKQRQAIEEQSE